MKNSNIICVIGPTSSGKSELAVKLAQKYNGEIISADSRQIYRGFNLSSGKVEGQWKDFPTKNLSKQTNAKKQIFIYKNIPHYLIDEASPKTQYSIAKFQRLGTKIVKDILKRGKTPIICGGTMHWVDGLATGQTIPEVKPNPELRKQLEQLTLPELFERLKKLDPERANNIDSKNPRRLIRALEIIDSTGKPVPTVTNKHEWSVIWIGINPGNEQLEKNIYKRILSRIKDGMIEEISDLHRNGLSWKKLEEFGLEFKFVSLFLQNKLSKQEMPKQEMIEQLFAAHKKYVKRQLTWWKRNKQIRWFKDSKQALLQIKL